MQLTLTVGWAMGNLALAVGLWHHERAWRRFFEHPTTGATFRNPAALVMGCALLLTLCAIFVVGSWIGVFGVRRTRWYRWLPAVGLSVTGAVLDAYLFWIGPFADTGEWESGPPGGHQMLFGAALAAAVTMIAAVVATLSIVERILRLSRI